MINAPSSSVGIATIQIAKTVGAKPVAITTSPEKSKMLLGLGAVAVFSPTDAELPKKIDHLSGGFGARVIFDAVGGLGAVLLQSAASVGGRHLRVLAGRGLVGPPTELSLPPSKPSWTR